MARDEQFPGHLRSTSWMVAGYYNALQKQTNTSGAWPLACHSAHENVAASYTVP